MTKKQLKKEFAENRTSWKFFNRKIRDSGEISQEQFIAWGVQIQLEILKELQFLNDK